MCFDSDLKKRFQDFLGVLQKPKNRELTLAVFRDCDAIAEDFGCVWLRPNHCCGVTSTADG